MPKLRPVLLALILLTSGAQAVAQHAADPQLDFLRAEAARAEMTGFERTTRDEKQGAKQPEIMVRVDRFNPRAAKGKQWTLVSVNGRAPTRAELAEHAKLVSSFPVPGYYRLAAILAAEPTRSTDAQGRTVYRWNSLPKDALPTPGPDVSHRMAAEAVVEKIAGRPMFSRVRIYAPGPISIMAVAKLRSFDLMNIYRPGEGGMPYLAAQTSLTDLSLPLGKNIHQTSQISFRPI